MFKQNVFSFNGRIKRTEFALSYLVYYIWYYSISALQSNKGAEIFLVVLFIPLSWVVMAQSAKRCHDLNKSGWWQLIPFYFIVLLFARGKDGPNEYGDGSEPELFYGADDYEKPFDIGEVPEPGINPESDGKYLPQ